MKLIKTILAFVQSRWDGKSPLLLGYSGGPDSKALLYAMVEAGIRPLHLAHVDHGWREESSREAAEIKLEAQSLGLECHQHVLTERAGSNLEETGRLARIQFFRSLFDRIPFQALLLAHHAGDLAETSLKRAFEGAHLCNLGGMAKESVLEGMNVWRPLLSLPKSDLGQFIQKRFLKPFIDRSNEDPRFLRARLRGDIIPMLEASFGKKICENLQLLSERSQELKRYLDLQIQSLWDSRIEGPWGWRIDLMGVDRIIQRHLLQNKIHSSLSRETLETALDALQKGSQLQVTDQLALERGTVFWSLGNPDFLEPIQIQPGRFSSGEWVLEIEPLERMSSTMKHPVLWQDLWMGRFEAALPNGILQIPKSTSFFREKWRQLKVPLNLRGKIPMVISESGQMFDLLTSFEQREFTLQWKARFFVHPKRELQKSAKIIPKIDEP
jgi:tRNA(Ile)-lysidine synthase